MMPLPAEMFDPARLLQARVDNRARVCVRQNYYSVPARYASRRLNVRLPAMKVEVLDGPRLVAVHERAAGKYAEVLTLDHYLDVLKYKPGATALAQARAAGALTASHQRYWDAARRARGDANGTRAMTEVLLGHRTLPADALIRAMDRAVTSGALDPQAVLIEARRLAGGPVAPVIPIGALARYDRPAPALDGYDALLKEHPVTGVSDTAALAAIGAAARELKLPTVRADAARLAEIAVRERQTHLAYLAELLSAEIDDHTSRRRTRRIAEARFPRLKRLADFNPGAIPGIAAQLATLASGAWIDAGEPVVALGDSGTGKTHLLIGLRLAACEQGRRIRYATTAQLANELAEAAGNRQLSRVVGRYGRLDLHADTQTIIWNRAALAGGGPAPRAGDEALSAALRLHNMIMSGGLDHALDVLTPEDFASAASGFRYLQLSDVAELVELAQGAPTDDLLEQLDARYSALIPRDQVISDQFKALLQQRPDDFAPASRRTTRPK